MRTAWSSSRRLDLACSKGIHTISVFFFFSLQCRFVTFTEYCRGQCLNSDFRSKIIRAASKCTHASPAWRRGGTVFKIGVLGVSFVFPLFFFSLFFSFFLFSLGQPRDRKIRAWNMCTRQREGVSFLSSYQSSLHWKGTPSGGGTRNRMDMGVLVTFVGGCQIVQRLNFERRKGSRLFSLANCWI